VVWILPRWEEERNLYPFSRSLSSAIRFSLLRRFCLCEEEKKENIYGRIYFGGWRNAAFLLLAKGGKTRAAGGGGRTPDARDLTLQLRLLLRALLPASPASAAAAHRCLPAAAPLHGDGREEVAGGSVRDDVNVSPARWWRTINHSFCIPGSCQRCWYSAAAQALLLPLSAKGGEKAD